MYSKDTVKYNLCNDLKQYSNTLVEMYSAYKIAYPFHVPNTNPNETLCFKAYEMDNTFVHIHTG